MTHWFSFTERGFSNMHVVGPVILKFKTVHFFELFKSQSVCLSASLTPSLARISNAFENDSWIVTRVSSVDINIPLQMLISQTLRGAVLNFQRRPSSMKKPS